NQSPERSRVQHQSFRAPEDIGAIPVRKPSRATKPAEPLPPSTRRYLLDQRAPDDRQSRSSTQPLISRRLTTKADRHAHANPVRDNAPRTKSHTIRRS